MIHCPKNNLNIGIRMEPVVRQLMCCIVYRPGTETWYTRTMYRCICSNCGKLKFQSSQIIFGTVCWYPAWLGGGGESYGRFGSVFTQDVNKQITTITHNSECQSIVQYSFEKSFIKKCLLSAHSACRIYLNNFRMNKAHDILKICNKIIFSDEAT